MNRQPKIGVALSGGGVRGFAHLGILRVLEELQTPIDLLAGTSMGGLVGGVFAAGVSPSRIETEIELNELRRGVAEAMAHYLTEIGANPGRAGHRLAVAAARVVALILSI